MIVVALGATRVLAAPAPQRIVVLDFDGRPPLAERGHTLVVALLAAHHDLVPSKRWEQARAAAATTLHGPAQWARAAQDAGVDAVIEGWVTDDHGRATINVLVRDAHDSSERTTATARFDANGTIPARATQPLLDAIEAALATMEPGPAPEPAAPEPMRTSRLDLAPAPTHEHHAIHARRAAPHASEPHEPDRFMIEAGGYVGSRSLTINAAGAMAFSGVASHGVQARAEVAPIAAIVIGGSVYQSAGSSLTFVDVTDATRHRLAIDQHGWELAAAYRHALADVVTVEGGLSYGAQAFSIAARPASFAVPDTRYLYIGAGARIEVRAFEALALGVGARYLDVLELGELASAAWYGPATARGLGVDATFAAALPAKLFVGGHLAYRRLSIESVGGGIDSQLTFHLNVGVTF